MAYVSACGRQGRRYNMEDEHLVETDFLDDGGSLSLYAVFDGHGGCDVSKFLKQKYASVLREECLKQLDGAGSETVTSVENRYKEALRCSFLRCDAELETLSKSQAQDWRIFGKDFGGSTAAVVLIHNRQMHAYVANVGDAEVVVGSFAPSNDDKISVDAEDEEQAAKTRQCIQESHKFAVVDDTKMQVRCLTVQHKPDNEEEAHRICSLGGSVVQYEIPRVNGILAVSRSFGDFEIVSRVVRQQTEAKPLYRKIISAEPHIAFCPLEAGNILVIACDGLWDVYSYEEAVRQSHFWISVDESLSRNGGADKESTDASNATDVLPRLNMAEKLCADAIKTRRSSDNVSVIVVRVGDREAPCGSSVLIAEAEDADENNQYLSDTDTEDSEHDEDDNEQYVDVARAKKRKLAQIK